MKAQSGVRYSVTAQEASTINRVRRSWSLATAVLAALLATASSDMSARLLPTDHTSLTPFPFEPLFTQTTGTVPTRDPGGDNLALRRGLLKILQPLAEEAILNAEAHVFNLFDDAQIVAFRSRVERHTGRSHSWFGHIPGDEFGRVIVAVHNGMLGVLVTHHARRYIVLPVTDSLYEVIEIDQGRLEEADDNLASRGIRDGGVPTGGSRDTRQIVPRTIDVDRRMQFLTPPFVYANANLARYEPVTDDGSVIDVMVVYTHEAAYAMDPVFVPFLHSFGPTHGPPLLLGLRVQLAIAETNQSFEDSQVDTRLNLVNQSEIWQYLEDPEMTVNLHNAIGGAIPTLHQLRDDWAADVVVLVAFGEVGKAGVTIGRRRADDFVTHAAQAYTVVKADRLGMTWEFAHELGHQFGTDHDWFTTMHRTDAQDVALGAHGFNLILPGPRPLVKRTIMTYNTYCFLQPEEGGLGIPRDQRSTLCPGIMRWSNVNQELHGLPLGGIAREVEPQVNQANEVKEMNANTLELANYRRAACRALSIC